MVLTFLGDCGILPGRPFFVHLKRSDTMTQPQTVNKNTIAMLGKLFRLLEDALNTQNEKRGELGVRATALEILEEMHSLLGNQDPPQYCEVEDDIEEALQDLACFQESIAEISLNENITRIWLNRQQAFLQSRFQPNPPKGRTNWLWRLDEVGQTA